MVPRYEIKINDEGELILVEFGVVTVIGTAKVNQWVSNQVNMLDDIKSMVRHLTASE